MANKSYKLSEPTVTSYPVFEEDQVLTSGQLNNITEYLDREYRLSRVKLTGAGIVCGLEVKYPMKGISAAKSITITKGSAITTDGDLLTFDKDRAFKYFKAFKDRIASYPYFIQNQKQIPLFELLPDADQGAKKLNAFEDETGKKMDAMALLLYLESYVHDPGICTGSDCDNKGKEQRNNLRVLLVFRSDLKSLIDQAQTANRFYSRLKEIDCERVLISPRDISTYSDLASGYRNVIKKFINNTAKIITGSYQACEPLLKNVYSNDPSEAWEKTFTQLDERIEEDDHGIQYVYDFIKDIASAYKEFKDTLFEDNAVCCPDVKLFPKHVILGSLTAVDQRLPSDPFRHQFYKSPLLNRKSPLWEKARFLHKRMDSMIRSFNVPASGKDIKVTPSKPEARLGSRAIPYYYKILKNNPLHRHWNYELNRRDKNNHLYSFNADVYNGSARALNPLNYPLDDYRFFRIEGHLGRKPAEAEKELKGIITSYNLPIKVTTLQIEKDLSILPLKPFYEYGSLKTLHFLLKKDLRENIRNVEDFNTKVVEIIQGSGELPPKSVTNTTASIKAVTSDSAGILKEQLQEIKGKLNKNLDEFDQPGFIKTYTSAVETASIINKNIKGVTYNSAYTPYETLVNNTKFKWFEWIDGILKKREKKSKELSLFARFLEENPGMEHTGGAEGGGTFVLVYSSAANKVIADFSMPYQCCKPTVEEEEAMAEDSDGRKKWTDLNEILVHPSKEGYLEEKIKSIDEKIGQKYEDLKFIIDTQAKSITQAYSGSLNTIIGNLMQAKVNPGVVSTYTDPGLKAEADALDGLTKTARAYEVKIASGTATEEEKRMRHELDKMIAETVKNTIINVSKKEGDIASGSQEEKLIEKARNSTSFIKNNDIRASLSNNISTIKTSVTGKTVLATALKGFSLNP